MAEEKLKKIKVKVLEKWGWNISGDVLLTGQHPKGTILDLDEEFYNSVKNKVKLEVIK